MCRLCDSCYKYQVFSNCVVLRDEARLYSNHEEADSRMIFHVSYLAENYSSTSDVNTVARSADTNSLINTIGCFQKLLEKNQKLRLWLEMGTETKKKYIAICQRESNILVFVSVTFFSVSSFPYLVWL